MLLYAFFNSFIGNPSSSSPPFSVPDPTALPPSSSSFSTPDPTALPSSNSSFSTTDPTALPYSNSSFSTPDPTALPSSNSSFSTPDPTTLLSSSSSFSTLHPTGLSPSSLQVHLPAVSPSILLRFTWYNPLAIPPSIHLVCLIRQTHLHQCPCHHMSLHHLDILICHFNQFQAPLLNK